jgi:uncharacterized protein (DUF488 family)
MIIYTIGHSTRSLDEFVALLRREGVTQLVDVRTFPGSRRYPHFDRETLAPALEAHGIAYVHMPELGGRRRPRPDSPNGAWRNSGFRGYADYMGTPEFAKGLDALIARSVAVPTAIMCAEAVPWRCHRSLIADALVARGIEVRHIMESTAEPHRLTRFAVVRDGRVTYPPEGPDASAQAELFQ